MSYWKPSRSPESYPKHWHEAICAAPGEYRLEVVSTLSEVQSVKNRFTAFKATLRYHTEHPSSKAEALRQTRMTVKPFGDRHLLMVRITWAPSALASAILTDSKT